MEKIYNIDFSTDNDEQLIDFGKKIKERKISEETVKVTLQQILKRNDYTEEEAIKFIRNLTMVCYYVPSEVIVFQAYAGEALLYLTGFINESGSPNYKILYALYKSQVEEDEKSFKKDAKYEIIEDMWERFNSLVNMDRSSASTMKIYFNNLISDMEEFKFELIK